MFFLFPGTMLVYRWILIFAAVIPALILMVKVYSSDKIEKESPRLLIRLVEAGILAALLALIEEKVGQWLIRLLIPQDTELFYLVLFFIVVGLSEESSKYLFMKKRTWDNPEFNYQYDGAVYALFTSLGFALWENISYVLDYGFSTALVRAVTAIPGHASFGVFMGVFYGAAKRAEVHGDSQKSRLYRILGVVTATLMHGAYDYLATSETGSGSFWFFVYVVLLFIFAYRTVSRSSKNDKSLDAD